jgi:glucose/mannose transport system substrate-binding protein
LSEVELLDADTGSTREPVERARGARLRELMQLHGSSLAHHLARLGVPSAEVDDAVQEVLIVAARKLREMRSGSERAFLFATALRVARNARRGCSRRDNLVASLHEVARQPSPTAEELAEEMQRRALLDDVIDHMPDEALLVFVLAELEELPVAAVAQRLGLPEGTVASRLRRARAYVEQCSSRLRSADAQRAFVQRPLAAATGIDAEILSWWIQRGETDALRALLGVYSQSHPGRQAVRSEAVGGNLLAHARLSTRMLHGQPPDTFQVNGGNALRSWVRRTSSGDQMDPIDFLFASEGWGSVFPVELLDLVSHRGRHYAVPLDIHRTNLLFYSPRIFAENGLNPPSTLEDMHSVAEILRARDIVPFALGLRDSWTLSMLTFEAVLVGEAGHEYYRAFCAGRRRASDVELKRALAHVGRILDYANEDAREMGWEGALDRVGEGRAAMTITGDWGKGYLTTKGCLVGEQFAMVPSPGPSRAFVFATDVFGLPKRASHKANAIELLRVFGSLEGQDAFNHLKGSIPARLDADASTYDTWARSSMREFRTGPRVPSMASMVPLAFPRALDRAMGEFARTHDPEVVLAAIGVHYDLLGR